MIIIIIIIIIALSIRFLQSDGLSYDICLELF